MTEPKPKRAKRVKPDPELVKLADSLQNRISANMDQPPRGGVSSDAMTSSIKPVRATTRTCWPRCRGERL
ncbi:hypothetical protein EMIT0P291_110145 [Pseudomonas sp. IT-P291]